MRSLFEAERFWRNNAGPGLSSLTRVRPVPSRQRQQQDDAADHAVKQPFHHEVPVGNNALEHIERRHLAEIGIGAGRKRSLLVCADRRMSTGSTHSFFSISRMRVSAEIGSANSTRSTRVRRATRRYRRPCRVSGCRHKYRARGRRCVVEHAEHVDIGIVLGLERLDQLLAVLSEPTTMVRRSSPLCGPSRAQRAQEHPLGDERGDADEKECREPEPRHFAPSLARKDAPMNSRNTKAQDEIIRVICRS